MHRALNRNDTMWRMLCVLVLLSGPTWVSAQMGGGMGGGRGGMGGRGGPPMGGRMGESMTKQFREMARLKPLLKGIALTDVQKDSLKAIEEAYTPKLEDYGKAMEKLLEGAGPGSPPDMEQLRELRTDALRVQEEEFALARAVVDVAQQPKFDENLTKYCEEEDKRQRARAERMRGMGRGGPPMGGGFPPF
ncbi:MAG: hypothetical protein MUF00_05600 [Gemmatimonadaceae bacterium]|nr:hypothetical protein [Gemmatimonadaceae bacterium]